MKSALCMAAAISAMGAIAVITPISAAAAPLGNLSVGTSSLVEKARYHGHRYDGRRCRTVRKVVFYRGVRRVIVRRVCRY